MPERAVSRRWSSPRRTRPQANSFEGPDPLSENVRPRPKSFPAGSPWHHRDTSAKTARRLENGSLPTRSIQSYSFRELRARFGFAPFAGGVLALDFVLKLYQAVEHHLRPWRASRDINIDRYDSVDALHGRIVVIETAGAGADSKRDDPLGVGHLLINSLQDGRHLVTDRAHNEEHVGLARRESG